jgi:hypothetical protein
MRGEVDFRPTLQKTGGPKICVSAKSFSDFAWSFIGFSPNNTVDDVIAKLGTPTKINDDSKYTFDVCYWDENSDHIWSLY